jgi:transposase InsO family protein
LGEYPADIPPFKIEVKKSDWETHKNCAPVRPQTAKKEAEIAKHIESMLRSGVIEPSNAHYWNHPVVVAKPDGSTRLCIDFRALNACSQPGTFPLLVIAATLLRIGEKKPDTFGVMDLTSGYHQAPLHHESRALTAFMCFSGVYQFTRVPFGPTRAPSYFQEMMAAVVLCGLVYFICEMYLDDCIVFGRGNKEFIERLRKVFQAFSNRNIFLKAKKCKFGLKKVVYVGKEISKDGINMADDKIQNVLDFPKPMTNTQLRSFLGLANYFREFVPNHSHVVHPLQKMIDHAASKRASIKWTQEGEAAFVKIKGLISQCPMLYFLNDTDPITLMTDASDYGIGGYLFQKVDGKERPIAFISKSLTEGQLRWSTIQKEAYAIFYCCKKLTSLIGNRKFTILMDHSNLQFLKNDSNPMVVRWWIAMQELDYILRFIPGVENIIADALSRLCPNLMKMQTGETPEAESEILAAISVSEPMPDSHAEIIVTCHNSTVGHNGVDRTLDRLLKAGHNWVGMRQHVKDFVKECACCQKTSAIKVAIQTLPYTTSTYEPMEVLNIDFVGPFPDKKYILVMVDTFTRWTELYSCDEATANSAAICLLQHFGRFGCPRILRSDRGSHFANETIDKFLKMTAVGQNLTLAYSSQENSKVERVNKEVNRHLRAFVFDTCSMDDYGRGIPFVQRIINSTPNIKTGISPAQLLFGNMIDLDRSIIVPYPERMDHDIPTNKILQQMIETQDRLSKITREIQQREDQIHMESISTPVTVFETGSFVLVKRTDGLPSRLHTAWLGPMRVLGNTGSEYRLLNLITMKEKLYHAQNMKLFLFNPHRTDPTDVARRDYVEFFVEKILDHRGSPKKFSTLEFLVKWSGYDDSHNSWEPYTNLRKTAGLHTYLREKNLLSAIPKEFR